MRRKTKTDFSANPQNVQIGDWVVREGQWAKDKGQRDVIGEVIGEQKVIGEVVARVDTSGNMLQFWVSWFDSISNHPTPELASNLIKIPKSEDGYVGQSISMGLISSMIWQDEQVKYEVVKDKQSIVKSREQIESALHSPTVNLENIIIDPNLQQRITLDNSVIDDYAFAYQEGIEFPPITIWKCTDEPGNREQGIGNNKDNAVPRYYLVDGFHRVAAAKQAGIEELPFIEKSGTYREALLFSLSVNATHGLRRSNEDKRKAVFTLLNDEEWRTWSNVAIAKQCGVSESFVRKIKKESHFAQNEVTTYTNKQRAKNFRGDDRYITVDGSQGDKFLIIPKSLKSFRR